MTGFAADLESLRQVDRAFVLKRGERAASLIRATMGFVSFQYLPEWVRNGRPPVATALPVGDTPVVGSGGGVPAFFEGLLPEGRRLGALRRGVKTSADDELSLLLAVGNDVVGDVQVVPEGTDPQTVPPHVVLDDVSRLRFSALLADLGIRPQRVGLPGVQDKTSAAMLNLPVSQAGERYILKLTPREYPHLVENEAFFLQAARSSGIVTPTARVLRDVDGEAGLLVRRFDRITADGATVALAVEDGCQVCNRPPADKYLLGAERVLGSLSAVCDARAAAARTFLLQLAFAYLTGNGDAHAKNFSIVQQPDGEWRPAPAYDLPSSQPYGDNTMALSMGGRVGPDFTLTDFVALGWELGVPERAVRRAVAELVERCENWLPDLDELPFDPGRVHKLRRVINYRRRLLRA